MVPDPVMLLLCNGSILILDPGLLKPPDPESSDERWVGSPLCLLCLFAPSPPALEGSPCIGDGNMDGDGADLSMVKRDTAGGDGDDNATALAMALPHVEWLQL